DGLRDRARRNERPGGPGRPGPAFRLTEADAVADEHVPRPAPQRDRPQREPHQPVPPRELSGVALPDARRLEARGHGGLPGEARPSRAPLRRSIGAAGAPGAAELSLERPVG